MTDRLTASPVTIADQTMLTDLIVKDGVCRVPWVSICPREPSGCFVPRPRR